MGAGVGGRGAIEEGGIVVLGAGGIGKEVRVLVELYQVDTLRYGEVAGVGVLGQLDGMLHECGPDGGGGMRTFQLDVGIVVIADPDDADEVGRVAGEPGIVRGAGFSRSGGLESEAADLCGGARVHHVLQHIGGEIGDARIEDGLGVRLMIGDGIPVGRADRGDLPGDDAGAVVGKGSVSTCHLDRGCAIGSQCDGRCALRVDDAGVAGECGNVVVANHLGELDGRVVQRILQGVARRHLAQAVVAVVARRIAALEGGGIIVQQGDFGKKAVAQSGVGGDRGSVRRSRAVLLRVANDAAVGIAVSGGVHYGRRRGELRAGKRGVEGRGVDKGLEDRACRPMGYGVVELGDAVIAAADQRQYLAGMWVESYQRDLWSGDGLGVLGSRATPFHQLIDRLHAFSDGFIGDLLQIGIERAVDAKALRGVLRLAVAADKLIVHDVDEVGSETAIDGARREAQRLLARRFGLGLGNVMRIHHGAEDDVAPRDRACALVMVGVQRARLLDHPGQKRAFCEIELADVLAEISLGGLAEAVDAERSLLAKRDLVGVHLKDLLLGVAVLKLKGDGDFDELALDVARRREEDAARKLHGERGGPATVAAITDQIVVDPAEQGIVVDAAVGEEAPVLNGRDSLDQRGWKLVIGDQTALGAVRALGDRGDELRLEFIRR